MEEGEPEVKRKKCYTKREALQKLEELSGNVAEVVGVYKLVNSCSHLLPQVQLLLTSAPLMQQKIWRSTTTSWLLCSPPWRKMTVLGQIWLFLGQNIQFLAEVSKSFGTHITEKLPKLLVCIALWSGMVSNGPNMPIFGLKYQFWAKFGLFWAKNPFFGGIE